MRRRQIALLFGQLPVFVVTAVLSSSWRREALWISAPSAGATAVVFAGVKSL